MDKTEIRELMFTFEQMQAREGWSRAELEAFQAKELKSLREYVYARSPFYREFHKGLYDAPLHELPVLTKSMLMENFDEVVTDAEIHLQDVKEFMKSRQGDERFLGRYVVHSTSGSTGQPGLFLMNSLEWLVSLAGAFRGFTGAGIKMDPKNPIKIAQITSTNPNHMSSGGATSMGGMGIPTMQLSASEPVEVMVEKLNSYQPDLFLAYASILRIFADEQLAGRLQIKPQTVISGSEVLTQETRRRSVQAWGDVLFNMYGTTDCGGIGAECDEHRGLHLQEDLVIVEVVDRNNHPVPALEYGEKLLVTVLWKRAQPLIRYELSDSVRLSPDHCPCGRPFTLIDDIQGRLQEVLTFQSVDNGTVNIHPIVFSNIMDTLPVSGWQVVQEPDGLYVLLSGISGSLDQETLSETIQEELANHGTVVPYVKIKEVPSIPAEASGKTPLVKSNLHRVSGH